MGFFKSKGKTNLEPPSGPNIEASPNDNYHNNSFTSSNLSSADTRVNSSQQAPKAVVTTTTTTTTTTTVDGDGTCHTQTQPYNPASDPPPATETVRTHEEPSNTQDVSPEDHGLRHSTSGGRPIPPRSELRNRQPSPNIDQQGLGTLGSQAPELPYRNSNAEAAVPNSPTSPTSSSNYSRPLGSHGGKFSNAIKGLHGAGEAFRGSVNSSIARGVGDQADYQRQSGIKQQGMREFNDSGFREKAEGRLRRRSASRELKSGAVGGGLERVDERVVNI